MSAALEAVTQSLGKTFQRARIGAGSIAFNQGNTVPLECPNALLQKGITLRLSGTLVVGVAAATVFSEAPLQLMKNVRIVGDGRRVLVNSPAQDLFRLAHLAHGKQWELSPPGTAVGNRPFSATIHISHEHLRALMPVESLFDPRVFKKVTVEITWGAATDIATAGGGGTIALSAVSCDVLLDQTSEGVQQILFDHEVTGDEQAVVASSNLFQFRVPQNGLLTGVLIRTTRDAGAGAGPVPVDDIVTAIGLKSDTTVAHADGVAWATLQRENVGMFNLDGGASAGAQIPGYAFLDLMENGQIASALQTNALNDLRLILAVTRTGNTEIVHVTYDWLVPRRAVATAVAA